MLRSAISDLLANQRHQSYPCLFTSWQNHGVSARASSVLARARIETVEQLRLLDRTALDGLPGCGAKTHDEIAALAGWPAATPVDAIAAALCLTIPDRDEAREAATDAVIALRRSGFIIVSAPAGCRQLAG